MLQKELAWIALQGDTTRALTLLTGQENMLFADKIKTKALLEECKDACMFCNCQEAKPDATEAQRAAIERVRVRTLERKHKKMADLEQRLQQIDIDTKANHLTVARIKNRDQLLAMQRHCESALAQLTIALGAMTGGLTLTATPLSADFPAPRTDEEQRMLKRAADELAGGDAKQLCCVMSVDHKKRIGFMNASRPASTILEADTDSESEADEEEAAASSDSSSSYSVIEVPTDFCRTAIVAATESSTNNAVGFENRVAHVYDVFFIHMVCMSAQHQSHSTKKKKRADILLLQQLDFVNGYFGRLGDGKMRLPCSQIRSHLLGIATEQKRNLAWMACRENSLCGFCRGENLNFECIEKARSAVGGAFGWRRTYFFTSIAQIGKNAANAKRLEELERQLEGDDEDEVEEARAPIANKKRKKTATVKRLKNLEHHATDNIVAPVAKKVANGASTPPPPLSSITPWVLPSLPPLLPAASSSAVSSSSSLSSSASK